MHKLTRDFSGDLGWRRHLPFHLYFDFVKNLPYMDNGFLLGDPQSEILARPGFFMRPEIFPGLDCKAKAVLIGAWCAENKVPYRYIACQEDPEEGDIHHVFPLVAATNGGFISADATFPSFFPGMTKPTLSKAEELFP